MATLPSLYRPLANRMEQCQLDALECIDQTAPLNDRLLSARNGSAVSLTPDQSFSSTSSIAHNSGPSTPVDSSMYANNGIVSYLRHMPVTPSSEVDEHALQASPCMQPSIHGPLDSAMNPDHTQWQSAGYLSPNGPKYFKSENSTPVRTRGSFVSDASSFSSPTSTGGYAEGEFQRALWTLDGLHDSDRQARDAEQAGLSFSSPFGNAIWLGECFNHNPERTVNPCDTVASLQNAYFPCEQQPSKPIFVPLVGQPASDPFIGAQLADCSSRDTFWQGGELSNGSSDGQSPPPPPPSKTDKQASARCSKVPKRRSQEGHLTKGRKLPKKQAYSESTGSFVEVPVWSAPKIACDKCIRSFTRLEHLKRHDKTHTGERPFFCSLSHAGGAQWHKGPPKNKPLPKEEEPLKGMGRSDNRNQHYLTHLRSRGLRNKGVDRPFLYYCIWREEPEKSGTTIGNLEVSLAKLDEKNKAVVPVVDHDLQRAHPYWSEYLTWLETDGTLESLGYVKDDAKEDSE